jgi:fermentation-respiration switch protein FrsA (DUF1100 family)
VSEKVTFAGTQGQLLAGRLERPRTEARAHAVFAHCFTCGKDVRAASIISRTLAAEGIAVLRFDFTGLGSSEGDFANTNFSSNVDDLVAAADHLAKEDRPPRLLIGHSLGGAAAIAAAARVPGAAVATIGAPYDPSHVLHLLEPDTDAIERAGEADVSIAGRTFRVRKQLLDDLAGHRMRSAIASLRRPLIVFHSPVDTIVGIENAREIFDAARHPKSFISLDQADHLLTRPDDARYVARALAAWASRYM